MKKIIIPLFIASLLLVSCQESKPKLFERLAKEQTQKCPVVISEGIILDSIVYKSAENINQYYYKLTGIMDDKEKIRDNKEVVKESLIQDARNTLELKAYKDYNTTLEYIYRSQKDGTEILKVTITSAQY